MFDTAPIGKTFGAVLVDVEDTAYHAGDTVTAQFVGANPRVYFFIVLSSEKLT
jgi:neutral ceramidase